MTKNETIQKVDKLLFSPQTVHDKEDFCVTSEDIKNNTGNSKKKDEEFGKIYVEYLEELQDAEAQASYLSEKRQLELKRGNIVHFIHPIPGYVLKSIVNGEKKGFINICSNRLIRKAPSQIDEKLGVPFAQSPPREDVDKSGSLCVVYDVIFNPETLASGRKDKALREKLENTAIQSVEESFGITLDKNNVKKPKLKYKGLVRATAIKYDIGDCMPYAIDPIVTKNELQAHIQSRASNSKATSELSQTLKENVSENGNNKATSPIPMEKTRKSKSFPGLKSRFTLTRSISDGNEGDDDESWTEPRYSIKYRTQVDVQDLGSDNRKIGTKSTPDDLILTVDLPLLRDSTTLEADVVDGGHSFELKSELRARYKLKLKLPYQVIGESAKATFDKDNRKLTVTMKCCHKSASVKQMQEGLYLKSEEGKKAFDTDDETSFDCGNGEAGSLPNLEKPIEVISDWTHSGTIKGILKRSGRVRSLSESFVDKLSILRSVKDESISLESLNEEVESDEVLSASPTHEKSVRFNDSVQRQLYRSNSSILGQKKKNQRKNKNKKKARERANSEGSASSLDVDADDEDHGYTSSSSIAGHPTIRNVSSLIKNRANNGEENEDHESPLSSSVE